MNPLTERPRTDLALRISQTNSELVIAAVRLMTDEDEIDLKFSGYTQIRMSGENGQNPEMLVRLMHVRTDNDDMNASDLAELLATATDRPDGIRIDAADKRTGCLVPHLEISRIQIITRDIKLDVTELGRIIRTEPVTPTANAAQADGRLYKFVRTEHSSPVMMRQFVAFERTLSASELDMLKDRMHTARMLHPKAPMFAQVSLALDMFVRDGGPKGMFWEPDVAGVIQYNMSDYSPEGCKARDLTPRPDRKD